MSSDRFLRRYDAMCCDAAAAVMKRYSTSFTMATKLLPGQTKVDIRNLYAVVRIADEIVDGTAQQASVADVSALLDAYEVAVLAAPSQRFHSDPILHAYAQTARRCAFDPAHITAFFTSMRRDANQTTYTQNDFDEYVYGSAEVIGLLCLSTFTAGMPFSPAEEAKLAEGARSLGAAFQKVNFLRDIAVDSRELGRSYFPGINPAANQPLDDAAKDAIVADIRADLAVARQSIGLLPRRVRAGVVAAADLFEELTNMIDVTPASVLATTRISVPRRRKLWLTARAASRVAGQRQSMSSFSEDPRQ
ncbi:phytoene/squalene synthase family protein [Corynebacterium sp. MSK041]|nr:phytoene/squalene synthase family protein [Corynebacterium sp. MSK041]MDK8794656.1 phytoene/squalene synthase family protein [Corynebacterium sp. MSK041]